MIGSRRRRRPSAAPTWNSWAVATVTSSRCQSRSSAERACRRSGSRRRRPKPLGPLRLAKRRICCASWRLRSGASAGQSWTNSDRSSPRLTPRALGGPPPWPASPRSTRCSPSPTSRGARASAAREWSTEPSLSSRSEAARTRASRRLAVTSSATTSPSAGPPPTCSSSPGRTWAASRRSCARRRWRRCWRTSGRLCPRTQARGSPSLIALWRASAPATTRAPASPHSSARCARPPSWSAARRLGRSSASTRLAAGLLPATGLPSPRRFVNTSPRKQKR
mmetsp:Transcript_26384/g.88710  ORF Transcript_26384/g.88710 Transcript_26384/m.88710 type:complete len:279 (+) Transcript_26384:974-1810(+)